MILYHGGTEVVALPRLIKSEAGRDFGYAFYTTDILEQAKRWALRKALVAQRINPDARAIVNAYEFNEAEARQILHFKVFAGPDMDWLELVLNCRSNPEFRHEFDIVIGNIANDNVGETVSYVQQGIMRKEDALNRLKFERINNQLAFCTARSFDFLQYTGHSAVEEPE